MSTITEQVGKQMGEALARGKERWIADNMKLIFLRLELIRLELDLFLVGGPIPGEENK